MQNVSTFRSFMQGGFESSTHRLRNGRRLDIIGATKHDRHVVADYQRLAAYGVRTVRDAVRWHLVERSPGRYDWSSVLPMIRAAHANGTQVIWDICHYGWPDDLDIWKPEFVHRFAALARAFAACIAEETDDAPFFTPINEISFLAWGGADAAYLFPWEHGRGLELKVQLARAAIEGIEAIWSVVPQARIVHVDPVINVVAGSNRPNDVNAAEGARHSQYQGWDLLSGRMWPQIGGDPKYLDIIGANYYYNNQWMHHGPPILRGHPQYRRFREILREVYERYERPILVSETGIEGDARPEWLRYIGREVRAALRGGVPVEGMCWYPIINHPGWDDDRYLRNGLLDFADARGVRDVYAPLAREFRRQAQQFRHLNQALDEDVIDAVAEEAAEDELVLEEV